ncbi:MAG: adenylosuccinate lyase, partial [Pseudomonadota bacterium]
MIPRYSRPEMVAIWSPETKFRIWYEIEAVTKHDEIAFLTHLAEIIVNDEALFVQQGMTTSDVLDTTINVQLV